MHKPCHKPLWRRIHPSKSYVNWDIYVKICMVNFTYCWCFLNTSYFCCSFQSWYYIAINFIIVFFFFQKSSSNETMWIFCAQKYVNGRVLLIIEMFLLCNCPSVLFFWDLVPLNKNQNKRFLSLYSFICVDITCSFINDVSFDCRVRPILFSD